MRDQATALRQLVLRSSQRHAATHPDVPAPRILTLCGGKGGVGVSTLTVNLSVALAEQGYRVVLLDADMYRADIAMLCGVADDPCVVDILSGRRDIHEVLQRGPAGIQVVPGRWAPDTLTEMTDVGQQRLLRQCLTLGRHADVVLLDAGSSAGEFAHRYWAAADEVVVVSTMDAVSVMDTYATVKTQQEAAQQTRVRLVVNRCRSEHEGHDVFQRIDRSCQRFLGFSVGMLGHVLESPHLARVQTHAQPLVLQHPSDPVSASLRDLAEQLAVDLTLNQPRLSAA